MNNPSPVKIECPACGQHYSVELGNNEVTLTCPKCDAIFTACREEESQQPQTESSHVPEDSIQNFAKPTPRSIPVRVPLPAAKKTILDKFIGLMFRFGKSFSGFLAVIFLIGILLSMWVFVSHLRSSFKVPTYDQITASSETGDGQKGEVDSADLDDRRDVEKRFGDDVAALVKEYSLGDSAYDELLVIIRNFEVDYRKSYVSGLKDALDDAAKAKKDKDGKSPPSSIEVVRIYSVAFEEAMEKVTASKAENTNTRKIALGSVLLCCFMLFMMLIIPALLKIEENTRKPLA